MNIDEYEKSGRKLYQQFAKIVKNTLVKLTKEKYALHQIQDRPKTVKSLKDKIKQEYELKAGFDPNKIEETCSDLAGCRIIFRFNNDVINFINSGVINANFKVVPGSYKTYYPNNSELANDYYIADRFVVQLDENRIASARYKKFKGLKCEIQIHTILNHAWSETNHDILYKPPVLDEYGKKILASINDQLIQIKKDYLIPAGHKFQLVQNDYQQLLAGIDFIKNNNIQEMSKDIDNNKRYEILNRYRKYVFPHYDSKVHKLQELIDLITLAVAKSNNSEVISIATPDGYLGGKTTSDILSLCLEMLGDVGCINVETTFLTLIKFYVETIDEQDKRKIESAVEDLAEYKISILKELGVYVQYYLISAILKWDIEKLVALRGLVLSVCKSVLKLEANGVSWEYDKSMQATFSRENVPGIVEILHVRCSSIDLLTKLYNADNSEEGKWEIISILNAGIQFTVRGVEVNEINLLGIILQNRKQIVDFYINKAPNERYPILQKMEYQVRSIYKFSHVIEEKFPTTITNIKNELQESVSSFRSEVDKVKYYVIYKTLMGHKYLPLKHWDHNLSYEDLALEREQQIKLLSCSIDELNSHDWIKLILECMKTKSRDSGVFYGADFKYFCSFLEMIAEQNPRFIFKLIVEHEFQIVEFIVPILNGLLRSAQSEEALTLINTWIKEEKYLWYCAKIFEFHKDLSVTILSNIVDKAILNSNAEVLSQALSSAIVLYGDKTKIVIEEIIFKIFIELNKLEYTKWIFPLWYRQEWNIFINNIDSSSIDIILDNFVFVNEIKSEAEALLTPIAEKFPAKVIEFFGRRFSRRKVRNTVARYDAIPFEFNQLKDSLSTIPELAVDIVSQWYSDYTDFHYYGARLLAIMFPDFPKPFEEKLMSLISSGNARDLEIVIAILRNYSGQLFVYNVCKEIVTVLPEESPLLENVLLILQATGVVQGYGFVETYEYKKQAIVGWLESQNYKVKRFAEKYLSDLDIMIASERRRVAQEIAAMKHQFEK